MLEVEYVPLETIKPYERNAKVHTPEHIEQIKKSIEEFGFNDPVAIWNGEIVEGHGRYFAAKALGLREIPVLRLDGLTDEQRRAYALVHNKMTMLTGFDLGLLMKELKSIKDIDMTDYGLETSESIGEDLEDFFTGVETSGTKEEGEEQVEFTIRPGEHREMVIDYLTAGGFEYAER